MKCPRIVRHKSIDSGVFFMTKYSTKFKVQIVKAYLDGEGGFSYLAKKFGLSSSYNLRKWVDLVKEQGFQALQL